MVRACAFAAQRYDDTQVTKNHPRRLRIRELSR